MAPLSAKAPPAPVAPPQGAVEATAEFSALVLAADAGAQSPSRQEGAREGLEERADKASGPPGVPDAAEIGGRRNPVEISQAFLSALIGAHLPEANGASPREAGVLAAPRSARDPHASRPGSPPAVATTQAPEPQAPNLETLLAETAAPAFPVEDGQSPAPTHGSVADKRDGSKVTDIVELAAGAPRVQATLAETHFAPGDGSIAAQIGAAVQSIRDAAGREAASISESAIAPRAAQPAERPTIAPALRVLVIELAPESLGAVRINVRLAGDSVRMTIEAAIARTVERVREAQPELQAILARAGFDADEILVTGVSRTSAAEFVAPANAAASAGAAQDPPGATARHFAQDGHGQKSARARKDDARNERGGENNPTGVGAAPRRRALLL